MAAKKSKDNWQRFASTLTLHLTKELMNIAKETERDIIKIVDDKLYETYITNVELSYQPRSEIGKQIKDYNSEEYRAHKKKKTYNNTGTFINSIYTEKDGNTIKVKIQDLPYTTDGRTEGGSTVDVYKYLTEGTRGGGYYYHDTISSRIGGKNYPTPAHPFEEQTMEQMKGFLDGLSVDIKNGKYSGRRYYKKWR